MNNLIFKNLKFILSILIILCCNSNNEVIYFNKLKKNNIFVSFKNKTIVIGGERNKSIIFYKTFKDGNVNEYVFNITNTSLKLIRDSIQFKEDVDINNLNEKILKMKKFNITSILYDLKSEGIDFEIYLKDGTKRIYIENIKNVRTLFWKNYINNSIRINDNWYIPNN